MTDPTQLQAYADGELAPEETRRLRESLKDDPASAAEVDAVLNLKAFLAANAPRHEAPDAWRACVRRLDEIDRSRRVNGFVGRYAWALCGAMFLFILSGRAAMRNVNGDSVRTADFLGRSMAPATARSRAESKLYGDLLRSLSRDIDPTEMEIFAPNLGRVHDLPAVRNAMRDRKGDLALVRVLGSINPEDATPLPSDPQKSVGIADGKNFLMWREGDETWILSGERSANDLGQVAERLKSVR